MADEAVRLCEHVAAGYGMSVDAVYTAEYPVTVNDADPGGLRRRVSREVFGDDGYEPMESPLTGAEDFSRVLAQVPGCYLFLGACPTDDWATAPSNHSPRRGLRRLRAASRRPVAQRAGDPRPAPRPSDRRVLNRRQPDGHPSAPVTSCVLMRAASRTVPACGATTCSQRDGAASMHAAPASTTHSRLELTWTRAVPADAK